MPLKVHLYQHNSSEFINDINVRIDPEIQVTIGKERVFSNDFEILVHPNPSRDWIESSQDLRAIIIPWAGIPEKTRELMKDYPDISLHNLHHNNYNTAEFCLALLLTAAKRIIPMDQALRNNDWSPRYEETEAIALRGKNALILGYGEIGQALGVYCLALGMNVMATRRYPEKTKDSKGIHLYPHNQLIDLLPKTQILLIALPLTVETRDLIGEQELGLMPSGGILVNVGRGPIVNQQALYNALKKGQLRAAASDVWYNYPESKETRDNTPPADVPFGELDNFVLSPHRGGIVEEVEVQRAESLATILNTANRGEPIPNQVNLDLGY